jgi:hypothetical protein
MRDSEKKKEEKKSVYLRLAWKFGIPGSSRELVSFRDGERANNGAWPRRDQVGVFLLKV